MLDILAGKEGSYPGVGKGINAENIRMEKYDLARRTLPEIIPQASGMAAKEVYRLAWKNYKLSPWYIREAFRLLRGKRGREAGVNWWRLPPTAYKGIAPEARNGNGHGSETPIAPPVVRLTDRQRLILETMLEMQLTSEPRKERQQAIVRRINPQHDPSNYKHDFAALCKHGLIGSVKGRDGGAWLAPEGELRAPKEVSHGTGFAVNLFVDRS